MRTIDAGEDIVTRTFEYESFDELLDDLAKEIEFRNYRVTRIYDIDNIFEQPERGIGATITFERYKIVEFCNLGSCAELISQDLRAGVFMPVRFVVYRKAGASDVSISFLKPGAFARGFDSPRLSALATDLEKDMTDVVDELGF